MRRSLVILGNAGFVKQRGEIGVVWETEKGNVTSTTLEKPGCKREEKRTKA